MKNWRKILIEPERPMVEVIRLINEMASQFAIVVDEAGRIVGSVTDGDIRRGILAEVPLDAPIRRIMNPKPAVLDVGEDSESALRIMRHQHIHQLPVVDAQGQVVDVISLDDALAVNDLDNWVVIMAGGMGSRMWPLTKDLPKPMLPVADRPLLEHIVRSLADQGLRKLFVSVNYLADTIRDHFGDGSAFGLEIDYLAEPEPLGTCGGLSLLRERPERPLLVMNGDLLTHVNFRELLGFHARQNSLATVCVREYYYEVPFGVVEIEGSDLTQLVEKPVYRHLVNAGIYVLEPEALDHLNAGERLDMTQLLARLMRQGARPAVFPIHEYWRDVGRADDLEMARRDVMGRD